MESARHKKKIRKIRARKRGGVNPLGLSLKNEIRTHKFCRGAEF